MCSHQDDYTSGEVINLMSSGIEQIVLLVWGNMFLLWQVSLIHPECTPAIKQSPHRSTTQFDMSCSVCPVIVPDVIIEWCNIVYC